MTTNETPEEKFTWPALPSNSREFEKLMQAMDEVLERQELQPFQREMHVPHLLWEAFGWSGTLFPDRSLANAPGFSGDALFAKAMAWYRQVYGERMNSEMSPGGVPVRLGNALWRLRFPVVFGMVTFFVSRQLATAVHVGPGQASSNMLDYVDGLTPAMAARLDDSQLNQFAQFFIDAIQTLQWRASLPDLPLFDVAGKDYDASTADLLGRRYGQSRWGAQQAVEKTLKAVLKHSGVPFHTGGPNGHNLAYLAQLLNSHHGIALSATLLDHAKCSPAVRYNEEPSSELQALQANHAVLGLLASLRDSANLSAVLANPSAAT
jgi:HEPN domain-containing protein